MSTIFEREATSCGRARAQGEGPGEESGRAAARRRALRARLCGKSTSGERGSTTRGLLEDSISMPALFTHTDTGPNLRGCALRRVSEVARAEGRALGLIVRREEGQSRLALRVIEQPQHVLKLCHVALDELNLVLMAGLLHVPNHNVCTLLPHHHSYCAADTGCTARHHCCPSLPPPSLARTSSPLDQSAGCARRGTASLSPASTLRESIPRRQRL